jgi:hypothetical protein
MSDPLTTSETIAQVITFWLDFAAGLLMHPFVTFVLGGSVIGSASESARAGVKNTFRKLKPTKKDEK